MTPLRITRAQMKIEIEQLKRQLADAQKLLRAIRAGDVGAVVVNGPGGNQIFTLQDTESLYRTLIEQMDEGVATLAADGTILYCNARMCSLLGVQREHVVRSNAASLFEESYKEQFETMLGAAMAGTFGKDEMQLVHQTGKTLWACVAVAAISDQDPVVACMVITDLTEHRKHEDMVAAGTLAQLILDNTEEGILVCDAVGTIIRCNAALRNLLVADPTLQNIFDVLPLTISAGNGASEPLSLKWLLDGNKISSAEMSLSRRDGNNYTFLVSAGRLLLKGSSAGCVLTLTDISSRKKAEEALLRSEKLTATSHFAAVMAHEINNPLESITNLLYLIQYETSLIEADMERLNGFSKVAMAEMERIAHITRQSLAFYRESGQPEPFEILAVINEVIGFFDPHFKTKHIRTELKYDNEGHMVGFRGEAAQIFSNLIKNSIEAMEEGGTLRIHLTQRTITNMKDNCIFITDTGVGLRPNTAERVFEPFFTTKGSKGTGLGLWVVKDLVTKHGGKILVKSRSTGSRKGTMFLIFLPSPKFKKSSSSESIKKRTFEPFSDRAAS